MFGIPIDVLTMNEALEIISDNIERKKKTMVFTPNVDHIVKAYFDEEFRKIYSEAELSLVDGAPLVWLSGFFGKRLPHRINGTNLVLRLCDLSSRRGITLFLLGAESSRAQSAVKNIAGKFPKAAVVGVYSPPFGSLFDEKEATTIIRKINGCKPDIVFVAFGAAQQEKWIYKYRRQIDASICIGVGSAFDLISGHIRRAPRLLQATGLEWLFRLCQEPRRLWKRYFFSNVFFFYMVLSEMVLRICRRR